MTKEEAKKMGATHVIKLGESSTYIHYDCGCPFYLKKDGWFIYKGTFGSNGAIPI